MIAPLFKTMNGTLSNAKGDVALSPSAHPHLTGDKEFARCTSLSQINFSANRSFHSLREKLTFLIPDVIRHLGLGLHL